MQFDDTSHQRKSDAETAGGVVRVRFDLHEQIEHPLDLIGVDAPAVVSDANFELGRIGDDAYRDVAPVGGVFRRVVQQVDDGLSQANLVAVDDERSATRSDLQSMTP